MTNAHTMTYRGTRRSSHGATYAKVAARTFSSADNRLKMAQGLIVICAILGLFYAINLYSIISHTVALQHINSSSRALTTEVETLDTQYLALSSKITPDTLKSYGLEKGEVTFFIPRSSSLGHSGVGGHEL